MSSYHDIPALSVSQINIWWREGVYKYWKKSVFNPLRVKTEPTPAMIFGTLCHLMAFEPEKFDKEFAVSPAVDKRSKEGKEAHAAFEASLDGRVSVTPAQYEQAVAMRDALLDNPMSAQLLRDCMVEQSIEWVDGIARKAKPDAIKYGLIIDYKTGANIDWRNLGDYIFKMGYHRQAAYYCEAFMWKYNKEPDGFVFLFQDSEAPDIIEAATLDVQSLAIGLEECNIAAKDIQQRLKTNSWLPPFKIQEVCLPEWKIRQFHNKENQL